MSSLTFAEKHALEKALDMNWYVLDFSDRTFWDFVFDCTSLDIHDPKYQIEWTSKAKKLRYFWKVESDIIVWSLLFWFAEYIGDLGNKKIVYDIANRLKSGWNMQRNIELIHGKTDVFNLLKLEILWHFKNEKYIESLDRIHTLFHSYLLEVCSELHIENKKDELVSALLWKVKRDLYDKQKIVAWSFSEQVITKIIQILEKYHDVRNNKSLAHPNTLLSHHDAKFAVDAISICLSYIDSIVCKLSDNN